MAAVSSADSFLPVVSQHENSFFPSAVWHGLDGLAFLTFTLSEADGRTRCTIGIRHTLWTVSWPYRIRHT
jgi:hypothetical protein